MKNTYIDLKTRETEVLQVRKERNLNGFGIILVEIAFTVAAFFIASLISDCAGLWHSKASLGFDLFWYYGTGLDWADKAAKGFGFRKTFVNLFAALLFECAHAKLVEKCLGVTIADTEEHEESFAENVLLVSSLVRIVMYILPAIFSHSQNLNSWKDWGYKALYMDAVAHSRTWMFFWMLVGVVLTLILRAFAVQKNNLTIVLLQCKRTISRLFCACCLFLASLSQEYSSMPIVLKPSTTSLMFWQISSLRLKMWDISYLSTRKKGVPPGAPDFLYIMWYNHVQKETRWQQHRLIYM